LLFRILTKPRILIAYKERERRDRFVALSFCKPFLSKTHSLILQGELQSGNIACSSLHLAKIYL
jgi:hypothetical protein